MSAGVTKARKEDPRGPEAFTGYHRRARTNKIGLAYTVSRLVLVPAMTLIWRLDAWGLEKIPKQGSVLISPGHFSNMDHFIMAAFVRRKVRFIAKSNMFNKWIGWFISNGGCIPVLRGSWDTEMFSSATSALLAGQPVVSYTDGGRVRVGEVRKAKLGIAWLAYTTGTPILPVGIPNSRKLMKLSKQVVLFGELIIVPRVENPTREQQQKLADRVLAETIRLEDVARARMRSRELHFSWALAARLTFLVVSIIAVSALITDCIK